MICFVVGKKESLNNNIIIYSCIVFYNKFIFFFLGFNLFLLFRVEFKEIMI